jgi:tryptophan synthase beta chain
MQTTDGHRTIFDFSRTGLSGSWTYARKFICNGRAQFISITDEQAMEWGIKLSQMEGLIPHRKRMPLPF